MGFFRQEYWNGLPFSPPGDLPLPGIEPVHPASADRFFTTESPEKPYVTVKQLDVTYVNFLDFFSIP